MNAHFGGLLRQELINLETTSNYRRVRHTSTGSSRLSCDSNEQPSNNQGDMYTIASTLGYAYTVDTDSEEEEAI